LLQIKLQLLEQKVKNVEDWIVIADSDEFHSYAGKQQDTAQRS
jgi:hypothetical protein